MKASAWLLVAGLCLAHATVCYGSPKVTMGRSGHAHRGVRRRGLKATVPAKPKSGLDLLSPANALLLFGTVLTNLGQDFPEGRQSSTPLLGSTTIQDAVNSITSQYSDLQTALTSGTVQPQAPFCTFWGAGRLAQNIVGSVPTSGPLATALLSTPAVQYVTNTIGAVRPNVAATIDNGCAAYMPTDGETFSGYLTRAVGDAPVVQALSGAIQPLEAYIAQTNATIPSLSNFLNTYNTSSSIIPSLVGVGANLGFPWPTGLGTGNLMTQWFAPVSNLLTGARTNTVKTTNAKPPSPPSPPAPATGVFKDLYNAIVGYNATSKLFT